MSSIRLSIIIVSYNTCQLTLATIDSVLADLKTSPTLLKQTEIWIVDNHSTDDSAKTLRRLSLQHPDQIHVLVNNTNVGFARANNQAIQQAKGELLLLLNSDTVVKPGALASLVNTFTAHPVQDRTAQSVRTHDELDRLGIVAAQLLNSNGTVQHQGGSFPSLVSLAAHWLMLDDVPVLGAWLPSTQHTGHRATKGATTSSQELEIKDWVGGTAMMIRAEVVSEIGLLDQNIFMYGEDIEYCMRARAHHWDVAIQPTAQITHLGSASSTSANAVRGEFNGYLYIWSKHKPSWQLPLAKSILKTGALLRWWLFGTMVKDPARSTLYRQLWQSV